jgi:hypothetical protein
MVRQPVQSSMIRAWAFDDASETLELEFTNGRIYQYIGVSAFLARGFQSAASKGDFFLTRIDGRYSTQEIHQNVTGFDVSDPTA